MIPMNEKEKMLAGEKFDPSSKELLADKFAARQVCLAYNECESAENLEKLRNLFAIAGENLFIKPPFRCDYGYNIFLGDNVFINFDCVFLDAGRISIGSNVKFGPKAMIFAVDHPIQARIRAENVNIPMNVTIGDNVWVGGGAIIMPGISIGENSIIGAGSIVTHDVPPNVIVAGNPAKIIKRLDEENAP